ncbi:MAG: serine/threonine protein kinase [Synechococcus sp.]
MVIGSVLAQRYRIDQSLAPGQGAEGSRAQGILWRGSDLLASAAPVVLRQLRHPESQARFRRLWPLLQAVHHPQIPRFGGLLDAEDALWLVRDWQQGTVLDHIQRQRPQGPTGRQVVDADQVLVLLRELLPALAVLHAKGLVHGDLNPSHLLRRDQDGLPVLLHFGCLQRQGEQSITGAMAAFAPQAQRRLERAAAWMDLHALGVTALVLLSGRQPEQLRDPQTGGWVIPEGVDLEAPFHAVLTRLLSEHPEERFEHATAALEALSSEALSSEALPAESILVQAPAAVDASTAEAEGVFRRRLRTTEQERRQAVEGRLWPVVAALLGVAVVGTSISWLLLTRGRRPSAISAPEQSLSSRASQPPAEVDQRQQLLSRLRALQVDRSWFLNLIDASFLARHPERKGRLPGDGPNDAPLRRAWRALAEEWLARLAQLPPALRSRLGRLEDADWRQQRDRLTQQGVPPRVVEHWVTVSARFLLPDVAIQDKPPEPYRQLWFAAAMRSLAAMRIEALAARPQQATVLSSRVQAGGARLITIHVPEGHRLVLGINGTPLMQMTVYGAKGDVVAQRGPLRVVSLPLAAGTPVQVLVTNAGVSSGVLTLSCRADDQALKPPIPSTAEPVS